MIIDNPGNEQPITELYAFVSVDQNGNEGICSTGDSESQMPLVFGYERVALKFLPLVEEMAKGVPHMQFKLVKFTNREVLKTIGGETGVKQ